MLYTSRMGIRFGNYVFDGEARLLTRRGVVVEIEPKAFELLKVLLENRPRALSKAELDEVLWPQAFVSDSSLARLVSELRKVIGDDAKAPSFVRTVHGFGYAFCGEAVEVGVGCGAPPAVPRCWLVHGNQVVALAQGENFLGRAADSLIVIDSRQVSRQHTRIVVTTAGATLEDMASKNGTYVEGKRAEGPVALRDGDRIAVGPVVLTYRRGGESETTETELFGRDNG